LFHQRIVAGIASQHLSPTATEHPIASRRFGGATSDARPMAGRARHAPAARRK
jgi:hypothetical protein